MMGVDHDQYIPQMLSLWTVMVPDLSLMNPSLSSWNMLAASAEEKTRSIHGKPGPSPDLQKVIGRPHCVSS